MKSRTEEGPLKVVSPSVLQRITYNTKNTELDTTAAIINRLWVTRSRFLTKYMANINNMRPTAIDTKPDIAKGEALEITTSPRFGHANK